MKQFKIICVLSLSGFFSCQTNLSLFHKAEKSDLYNLNKIKTGFYDLGETIDFHNHKYSRFISRYNNKTVFDGFFSLYSSDTLKFLPYHSVQEGCELSPLNFLILSDRGFYDIGEICKPLNNPLKITNDNICRVLSVQENGSIIFDHTVYEFSKVSSENGNEGIAQKITYSYNTKQGISVEALDKKDHSYWCQY